MLDLLELLPRHHCERLERPAPFNTPAPAHSFSGPSFQGSQSPAPHHPDKPAGRVCLHHGPGRQAVHHHGCGGTGNLDGACWRGYIWFVSLRSRCLVEKRATTATLHRNPLPKDSHPPVALHAPPRRRKSLMRTLFSSPFLRRKTRLIPLQSSSCMGPKRVKRWRETAARPGHPSTDGYRTSSLLKNRRQRAVRFYFPIGLPKSSGTCGFRAHRRAQPRVEPA